jgi:BlaI family transcriptional regulator, penicillinase repressor
MRPANPTLTPQELEIMKAVWELRRAATVRDVYEALLLKRRIAYTTVMTMMNVLEKKGHLAKRAEGRAYLYEPVRPKQRVLGAMVRDFVERVLDGSAEPLLVHLIEERQLSDKDLQQLSRRIRGRR